MILDEKIIMFPPPPPYLSSSPTPSTPTHPSLPRRTLTSLPPHILLQIIHHTFPPILAPNPLPSYQNAQLQLYQDTMPEKQRKTLFWLSTHLRLVSRQMYTACMHVLRSTYLPAYQQLIRPPYTSDPFPLGVPTSSNSSSGSSSNHRLAPSSASVGSANGPPAYDTPTTPTTPSPGAQASPLLTLHRETPILDRFIALKVRQDVFADDTELHIDREDAFRDLFDVAQPRARLEDLVRVYGVREGVVSVPVYYTNGTAQDEQGEGARKVYGTGSQSSSLISLPHSPVAPQASAPLPPSPKPRRSFFSFKKSTSSTPSPSSSSPQLHFPPQPQIQPLPFSSLSISFSPRRIGLVLNRSRTIAEVPRLGVGRNREPLEVLARALVGELKVALGG
ncbi:hypothetical protein GALMADRAFT_1304183 [Galerina marginata CBS 339.88]|uniref:Uncharacterized protein n=1 Tax=Galerina marginata (strain CBS 339.88) TaxID=685588 RepID=A0A067T4P2_GALM3|nr:hypothetical protein GALMADRAFT_1304183 [Galerina marginata CBS 339.88]